MGSAGNVGIHVELSLNLFGDGGNNSWRVTRLRRPVVTRSLRADCPIRHEKNAKPFFIRKMVRKPSVDIGNELFRRNYLFCHDSLLKFGEEVPPDAVYSDERRDMTLTHQVADCATPEPELAVTALHRASGSGGREAMAHH